MTTFASKLRIGEKIGLSFGLVALLFLGVIWQYHHSLQRVLVNYQKLHHTFETRKTLAFEIESSLSAALQAEKNFLLSRDERFAAEAGAYVKELSQKVRELSIVDQESQQTAQEIDHLSAAYIEKFNAIAEAWRIKGLDHNSGLQGAFRERVHQLEDMAGNFQASRAYLQLLQIRRGEKDLGLRREAQYQNKVEQLTKEFVDLVQGSEFRSDVKQQLLEEIQTYSQTFETYAERVLADQGINGGKGPFRQTAHRIEAILVAHYVPDLEINILQLRRREKDYLLRNDKRYVAMAAQILQQIDRQIDSSQISTQDKSQLKKLVSDYRRDFMALVAQNDRIEKLAEEMREAADRITPVVKSNVDHASALTDAMVKNIAETSNNAARINLIVVIVGLALGIFFASYITSRIVRPVRDMAGLLDNLTHENQPERIPTVAGARDEINAMAESLNTMADQRATFISWWKASMREAVALRDLHSAQTEIERQDAINDARAAATSRLQQLNAVRGKMENHTKNIITRALSLQTSEHSAEIRQQAESLEHSARGLSDLLTIVKEDSTK